MIEAYFQAFINFEQKDWAKLLPMAKFIYNNAKKASIRHSLFELNCGYYLRVSFEEDTNLCSKLKTADKLLMELWDLMTVFWKNLYHAQELQKQAHNKSLKPRTYVYGNKVWLNSKYIKTK